MTRALWSRFTSHLYVRIWLAVVATIVVLTFAVGTAWQLTRPPPQLPIREIIVENAAGEVIGTAQTRPGRQRGDGLEFDVITKTGETLNISLPRPVRQPGANSPWIRPPMGFGWMLAIVGLAVALGAYPIIRRLTLRLEALQSGVERWGAGDLSTRLNADGKDEVAFLARRFNHAAERIETLMDSHKSLLANASHELRSPLARIRMALELIAPTLVASRTALPPEGAALPKGGLSAGPSPTLVASRPALPPEGAAYRGSGPARADLDGTQQDCVSQSGGVQGLRLRPGSAAPAVGKAAPTAPMIAMDEISRSITELDQLIDEILMASRLDAKQSDAEPFELVDLTGLAAEECARVGAELNAELNAGLDAELDADQHVDRTAQSAPSRLQRAVGDDCPEPAGDVGAAHSVSVAGSPRLLRRLIRNLLENARRYSTGDVDLTLSQRRVGTQRLAVIRVDDRGPGVPADQRERIFEPFYRLPGASERDGGVGLGLALVKSISQRHSGNVRCEARPGGGASFVVELPLGR